MKQKNSIKLVIGVITALSAHCATAQTFTSGVINYEILSEENLTVAIAESDNGYTGITTADLPEKVEHNGKTYTVTAIGDWGLYGTVFEGDIVLPGTITSIGEEGLSYCEGSVVTLPPNLQEYAESAFRTCLIAGWDIAGTATLLSAVDGVLMTKDKTTIVAYPVYKPGTVYTVPEYVTSLGEFMLANGAEYLEEMVFHSGLEIGSYAFKDAGNIRRIEIPSGTTLNEGSFAGCEGVTELVLHEGIREIPKNCFFDLCSMTTLTLPGSLEKIHQNGFGFCEKLKAVSFPDNLKEIGLNSFADCYALANVDFNKLGIVGEAAFSRCALTSAIMPEVTSIGEIAFTSCTALTSFEAPKLKSLGASAFFKCSSLRDVALPDCLESIGSTAFYECSALQSLNIPASVTLMGGGILTGTASLTSVTIDPANPNYTAIDNIIYTKDLSTVTAAPCGIREWEVTLPGSVTKIGLMAFRKCATLRKLVLPSELTAIGNHAFSDCTGITSVVSHNPVPPTGCAFPEAVYTGATLYVPDGNAVSAYREAEGWKNFLDIRAEQSSSIDNITGMRDILSVEYFDLEGRQITLPSHGIFIKRTVYNDGTIRTNKAIIK